MRQLLNIRAFFAVGLLAATLSTTACGSEGASESSTTAPPGATGVTQAGAQDFGLFRAILDDGGIPGPETLDALGFFAEHKLDYPAPDCGDQLCMHGLVGVMGNMITGSNCTLIQIGMNTTLSVDDLERPPLHLVLAIDISGSMSGDPIDFVKAGLLRMLDSLEPGDLVSIVAYSDEARLLAEAVSVDDRLDLEKVIKQLSAGGATNIYDGLFRAFEAASRNADPAWQNRVVMLSDGVATAGIETSERMVSLARAYAREGIGITTIGVGKDFDVEVMRDISEVGSGNFYFLEDPAAVREVFTEEVKTFLHPVALDVQIGVTIGGGYYLGRAYGTNSWTSSRVGGLVDIPSLFLAGRTEAAAPIEGGRRGGGGAIILELVPRPVQSAVTEPRKIGDLTLRWTHPTTGEEHTQTIALDTPHAAGEMPVDGYFTDATVEKGFVMLNLFAGFQLATELADDSDVGGARGVLEALHGQVETWLLSNDDPDIRDDLTYVELFIQNLKDVAEQTPVTKPPEPWPFD